MDQLRAAVFTALLTGRDLESLLPAAASAEDDTSADAAGPAGHGHGREGERERGLAALIGSVNLTMPASAWLGLSQAPGELAKLGPQDAATCRDLAGRLAARPGTRWCVTLTSVDGRAVAHVRARAGPPGPPGQPGPRPGLSQAAWLTSLDFNLAGTRGLRPSAAGKRVPARP